YKKATKVLIQSEGFKAYILNQGIDENKLVFYPNSTESFYKPLPPKEQYLQQLPHGFKIIFAGNLGEAQSIPTILQAAKIIKSKGLDIKWVFLGDGRMKSAIQQKIKEEELETEVYLLGAFASEE